MKRVYWKLHIIIVALVIMIPNGYCSAKSLIQAPWALESETPISPITASILEDSPWHYHIEVIRDNKTLFSLTPAPPMTRDMGLRPIDIFNLDDGNFATIWKTAIGDYWHIIVLSYVNGKVAVVLQATSQLRPEFAYAKKLIPKVQKSKRIEHRRTELQFHFSAPEQQIVIPKAKWCGDGKELRPITADIYSWDKGTEKYNVRKDVPWEERFGK